MTGKVWLILSWPNLILDTLLNRRVSMTFKTPAPEISNTLYMVLAILLHAAGGD